MMKVSILMKKEMNLLNLPTPSNISFWWNFGSLLGIILISQMISGLFLTMNYYPTPLLAFFSISNISHNLWMGWLIRFTHALGASFMMLFIYLHIGRNIYFSNFKNFYVGISGLILFIMTMMTAFLGYVLPWGQMSFWGATVITSLASAIPLYGVSIVKWIWGNFAVSSSTLTRFFMLHFIFPFLILLFMIIHLSFLHINGSTSSLPFKNNLEMIEFHPKFSIKDSLPFILTFSLLILSNIISPFKLMDPENFIIANPLMTPTHIQPEWYFLFSYAILRCIPNKMGGVIALLTSISIISILIFKSPQIFNNSFIPSKKVIFWAFFNSVMILMWIGANSVSEPLVFLGQMFSAIYFSMILFL